MTRRFLDYTGVDLTKKIYVTEGQFDSLFLPNAVASGDANLAGVADHLRRLGECEVVLVFDREPRNKDLMKIIGRAIEDGEMVCLLPAILVIDYKDINDLVVRKVSPEYIKRIIDKNTYGTLQAELAFTKWRKC